MTENINLNNDISNKTKIIQTFDRAVKLFEKTGLHDLAEKWNKILNTYINRENLSRSI